ncbi:GNAT family N-acetyltransferase [Brachybacterium saurashtrense]|uniref:GNAT family N-acetyltransferase n=1 Tax=Brachybacterium saurashtrense TaxID=556288 RepID=A0A345YLB4_9MICO|nr:GNAT family N-acetyltransferase [Brachybacterium saurashtrense]AXK44716.1 GNAT family N-acetyltransferase [Brachybacterium saurashtrense]RRR23328.1 GNAT family N-acetyltransferase [Brachybacterium saurashtrense]
MPALHHAHLTEIDPRTVYLLAMLRQDVFTLEQGATDADLDGRELDASTELLWFSQPGPLAARAGLDSAPIAHLRILHDGDVVRIGRVAVHSAHRGGGLGRALMEAALARIAEVSPQAEVHLDAQAHLEQWYASMGFETVGGVFLEAGIEHVAMVRRPAVRA